MQNEGRKNKEPLTHRPDIEGLRAIAVLSVLIFHAFPKTLTGGFLGVDVFFVISGYLIARILFKEKVDRKVSILNFYARRVRRIFPALILVLSVCLCIGAIALLKNEFLQLARHTFYSTFGLANFSLFKDTGYFSLEAEFNPMLHMWSLGVEEQFYFMLPALIILTPWKKKYVFSIFSLYFFCLFCCV